MAVDTSHLFKMLQEITRIHGWKLKDAVVTRDFVDQQFDIDFKCEKGHETRDFKITITLSELNQAVILRGQHHDEMFVRLLVQKLKGEMK